MPSKAFEHQRDLVETTAVRWQRNLTADSRTLTRRGVAVARADWRLAGEVKADGDISLADAYAVALASDRDATLVAGGDNDFDELPVEINVERFRDHGV